MILGQKFSTEIGVKQSYRMIRLLEQYMKKQIIKTIKQFIKYSTLYIKH